MRIILIVILFLASCVAPKKCCAQNPFDGFFKYSTFYTAVNGGNSISDQSVFSVTTGLLTEDVVKTPFDYSATFGVRKIQRFQYEPATPFKDGTETSYNDAATLGRLKGKFEYLSEIDIRRQQGVKYIDQQHFIRYVANKWMTKVQYIQDGFADIEYFQASQRLRLRSDKKLSFNIGACQRISQPYGFDPLSIWLLDNGGIHYTYLAIQEGYSVDVYNSEYYDPSGELVATSPEVWEEVVIPGVISDYTRNEKDKLDRQWVHSLIIGFDYYTYKKDFWLHSWGNLLPYHYNDGGQYSYHNFNDGEQWLDYSTGIIFGYKITKNLGTFVEGVYNKYWDRKWYDFKVGVNYLIR